MPNLMVGKTWQELREKIGEVRGFNFTMKMLEESDLPMVCCWRNHPLVRPFMDDTREVTTDVLRFWYKRIIKKNTAVYYMVFWQNKPAGFVGLNRIDWERHTFVTERFLNPLYIGKRMGPRMALCLEQVVEKLGLETGYSYVKPSNFRMVAMLRRLGYKYTGGG